MIKYFFKLWLNSEGNADSIVLRIKRASKFLNVCHKDHQHV